MSLIKVTITAVKINEAIVINNNDSINNNDNYNNNNNNHNCSMIASEMIEPRPKIDTRRK